VDGWYEFRFPMVVGPRFNPPGSPRQPAESATEVSRSAPARLAQAFRVLLDHADACAGGFDHVQGVHLAQGRADDVPGFSHDREPWPIGSR